MAKKKSPVFERPRDEDGQFLPAELWTSKEIREYERAKAAGLLSPNPIKKKKLKGRKAKGKVWEPPRNDKGHFKPMAEWSKKERKAYERAKKQGYTTAAQMPRDDSGRWESPTGKPPKRKKTKQVAAAEQLAAELQREVVTIPQQGSGPVTVVYPPYPPQPAPTPAQPAAAPTIIPIQLERQAEQKQELPPVLRTFEDGSEDHQLELFEHDGKLFQFDPNEQQFHACRCLGDVVCETDVEDLAPRRNPRDRHPMYYVKRTFSEKVGDALGFVREKPLLVLLAVGALALVGYAIYRAFKAYRLRLSGGVDIVNNAIYFPGVEPYTITPLDKLWLIRSLWGEVSRDAASWSSPDVRQGGAAILWCYANHFLTVGRKREIFHTLGDFVQAYSQPINPRWIDPDGEKCRQSPQMCTSERIAFRRALRDKQWGEFPPHLQELVDSFAEGRLPNPVGTRTDFRASGTGYQPADAIVVAGNVFGTAAQARRRPTEQTA